MAELPKQELLIKLLNMTTAEDNVALVAIRKANDMLASAGWTWEQLLRGKITIVEDPFNHLDNMFTAAQAPATTARPTAPPRPKQPYQAQTHNPYAAPQNTPYHATLQTPVSPLVNKFLGYCYCCGVEVPASTGYAFKPDTKNPAAPSKWHVVCTPCNTTGIVYANPTGQRPSKKRGKADIHSLI